MFGGEASDKYVRYLSGGERTRLAMIRLLLQPVNLLILDEPTNHLDMVSKDVLKEAIRAFDGTVIVVSHDREFLDGLVDKVYEFGNGKVREHLGGIYDYLRTKNAQTIEESLRTTPPPPPSKSSRPSKPSPSGKSGPSSKNRKKMKTLEEQIEKLEQQKAELDELLLLPENAANMQMVTQYTELQAELDKLEEEYFSLE